jgi:hypothetical protein
MSKYHRLIVRLISSYIVLMKAAYLTTILPLAMDGVSSSQMARIKTAHQNHIHSRMSAWNSPQWTTATKAMDDGITGHCHVCSQREVRHGQTGESAQIVYARTNSSSVRAWVVAIVCARKGHGLGLGQADVNLGAEWIGFGSANGPRLGGVK